MSDRSLRKFHPHLERLETIQLLSANASAARNSDRVAPQVHAAVMPRPPRSAGVMLADNQTGFSVLSSDPNQPVPPIGINLSRVTNPSKSGDNARLIPPYGHVLVQSQTPIRGQVYNILFVSVFNGTGRTFNAGDGLTVRTTNTPAGKAFPILTGDQVWPAGGRIVFYVLSKKYYPLLPTQSGGFQFNFIDSRLPRVTAIPGPSGIALRVKFLPATFQKTLDFYVTSGPGAIGHRFGLPDTALWEIIPASQRVIPL